MRHRNKSGKDEWTVPHLSFTSLLMGSKHVDFPTDEQFQVSGLKVNTITSVLEPSIKHKTNLTASGATPQHLGDFGHWISATLKMVQDASSDEDQAVETHWRILIHNRADTKDPKVKTVIDIDDKFNRRKPYANLMRILGSGDVQHLREADDDTRRYYYQVFLMHQSFPRWFLTSNGLVGRSYAIP